MLAGVSSVAFATPIEFKPILDGPAATPEPASEPVPETVPEPVMAQPEQTPALLPQLTDAADDGQPDDAEPKSDGSKLDEAKILTVLRDIKDNPQKYKFTYDDIWLAAKLVYAEGRNQSSKSAFAMASIIYNRLNSKKFPDTMEKIAYAPGQFTVAFNDSFATLTPSFTAVNAVIEVFMNNGSTLPKDVMYFKSARKSKKWGKRVYYDTIDGNMYYS